MVPSLHLIGVSVGFCVHGALATPLPFYGVLEGSTFEEEVSNFTSSAPTSVLFSEHQPTPGSPAHVDVDFLGQVENFLQENLLLILVVTVLIFVLTVMICAAVFMSHRRKVNAYYPSSFPSKMYVDHRDKAGGAKPFHEVPEKSRPEQKSEPLDSHSQLQADIMKASRNLRTSHRPAEDGDPGQTDDRHGPEDTPHDQVLEEQIQRRPEEEEPCQLSVSLEEEGEEPQEPSCLRPSSLLLHSDSATLQLIQGEKTAF
ncbi:transmembrane protein 119-like isoform X2 [Sphaeramia orbicularis]|uniref:transmembrane protein 119-like isoform X2 n=1 Tax=Sphaeramia orbicularis TaxID=375764 RepID=UPI0011817517|nr:transmembrane protein 119-like isoform X2 [Sphaeramia orbicularis]XP_030006551.1 transmembrane protein 119-like isoform X2 [Sphaeramia orbicularis]